MQVEYCRKLNYSVNRIVEYTTSGDSRTSSTDDLLFLKYKIDFSNIYLKWFRDIQPQCTEVIKVK